MFGTSSGSRLRGTAWSEPLNLDLPSEGLLRMKQEFEAMGLGRVFSMRPPHSRLRVTEN